MFEPTLPGESNLNLMHVSDFHPDDSAAAEPVDAGSTKLSALNPSLLQDLLRFGPQSRQATPDERAEGLDPMEVLAAALRHARTLLVHLQLDYRVIPLTVMPASRQLLCPLPLALLLGLRLPELRVMRVEPAPAPKADAELAPQPLGPLLWELALRGARGTLLPEIAGVASYRVSPGIDLAQIDLSGSLAHAVMRLRLQTVPLREIAAWPGFDTDRAQRLLNALYLQSALIVSRSHPGSVSGL
jgi:hypothetical protein